MATVNLGSIKFKWKGTYAGGTAYTIDDVVSYNGSSYICILASTGNLPTNATYFEQMSSAGTNGTDLTTTLTTQGDILYRDGSGLQRLAKGTAGQVLQMNSGATAPEYGTVSSDFVLLGTSNMGGASAYIIDNVFSSTYDSYVVKISGATVGTDCFGEFIFRSGGASGSNEQSAQYKYSHTRQENASSVNAVASTLVGWNNTNAQFTQSSDANAGRPMNTTIEIFNASASYPTFWRNSSVAWDAGGSYIVNMTGGGVYETNAVITGFKVMTSTGVNWNAGTLKIYGLK